MTSIAFNGDYCPGEVITPSVTGTEGATRFEWSLVDSNAGAVAVFSAPDSDASTITVNEIGDYVVRLCAYFDEGEVESLEPDAPAIGCPISVLAGEPATITLTGCDAGQVEWSVNGAASTGVTGTIDGALVTTDIDATGAVTVMVECTTYDADNVPTTETLTCGFEVLPFDTQFVYETSPATEVEFIPCGQRCLCSEATISVNCAEPVEECAEIGFVFIDCEPCDDAEECPPVEPIALVGAATATLSECTELMDMGCEEVCCEPHMPVLLWNNIMACPDWTVSAPAVAGSNVYNAASCNPGQKWCFNGSATLVASGPAQFVDVLVIWGHNIASGGVTVSPFGSAADIEVVDDGACIEGYTRPVVVNFAGVNAAVSAVTVTIQSADGGEVCIDQVFIGQKLFLPEDRLPMNFNNPHESVDYKVEFAESECGPLSRSLVHTPIPFSLDIECVSEDWACEFWRPFIRYAIRHGFMFQWSRNRKPDDIFNGWIDGPIGGGNYVTPQEKTLTLSGRGYITQPQLKSFA